MINYNTHNDKAIDVCGSHLQGYCPDGTTYKILIKLFGKPCEGDAYKVDAEWNVQFEDGQIATIYNYKTGKNYCGKHGIAKTKLIGDNWHIGGFKPEVVNRIHDLITKETDHIFKALEAVENMQPHTPTPWDINAYNLSEIIKVNDGPDHEGKTYTDGRHSVKVANTMGAEHLTWGERHANATFIVQACNAHYDMVAALAWAMGVIEIAEQHAPKIDWSIGHFGRKERANAALAKAKAVQ